MITSRVKDFARSLQAGALLLAGGLGGCDADRSVDTLQTPLARTETAVLMRNGWSLQPRARWTVQARVLARRDYADDMAAIAPTDLVLGWGPMRSPEAAQALNVRQQDRFYHWWVRRFPVPRRDIERHTANVHVIPAGAAIAAALAAVRPGAVLRLGGRLVDARSPERQHWPTSLSRDDTGAGACELLLLESVERLPADAMPTSDPGEPDLPASGQAGA